MSGFSRNHAPLTSGGQTHHFCLHHMACGILDPWSGIEPTSPGLEAQRLSHWTSREVSQCYFLNALIVMHPVLFGWIWLKECPVVQAPLLGFLLQVSFLWNPTRSPADRLFGGLCPWVTGSGRKKRGGWSHNKADLYLRLKPGALNLGDSGLAPRVHERSSLNIKKLSVHFLQRGFRVFTRFSLDIAPDGSRTSILTEGSSASRGWQREVWGFFFLTSLVFHWWGQK